MFTKSSGLVKIPLLGLPSSQPNNSPGSTAPGSLMYFWRFCYQNLATKSSLTNRTVEAKLFFYWQECVFFGEMVLLAK